MKERLREPVWESDVEGEAVLTNEGQLVIKLVDAMSDMEESVLATTYFLQCLLVFFVSSDPLRLFFSNYFKLNGGAVHVLVHV